MQQNESLADGCQVYALCVYEDELYAGTWCDRRRPTATDTHARTHGHTHTHTHTISFFRCRCSHGFAPAAPHPAVQSHSGQRLPHTIHDPRFETALFQAGGEGLPSAGGEPGCDGWTDRRGP